MATPRKTTATTKTATTSKFASTLSRDNKQIRYERAIRISESVSDAQQKLIMDIKSKIRGRENELESMMDLSTDNTNTSMNVISESFNPDDFVTRINTLKKEIKLFTIELEIAEETNEEWFSTEG